MKTPQLFCRIIYTKNLAVNVFMILLAVLFTSSNLSADVIRAHFTKGGTEAADDLHVEFNGAVTDIKVTDNLGNGVNPANPGPFPLPPGGKGTNKIDFAGGSVAGGAKAPNDIAAPATETYYEFTSGTSPLKITDWWWTKKDPTDPTGKRRYKMKKVPGDCAKIIDQAGNTTTLCSASNPSVPRSSSVYPPNGPYSSPLGLASVYPVSNLMIRNISHNGFAPQLPSPPPGGIIVYNFSGTAMFEVSMDGGNSWQPHSVPTNSTVRLSHTSTNGSTESYQTEMLQLSLQGGTLPPGIMIRESPTLASMGETDIRNDLTSFRIHSFFDVFSELSIDGGQTWVPAAAPPIILLLDDGPTLLIPTLTEWALIILGLTLLGVGIFYLKKRRLA